MFNCVGQGNAIEISQEGKVGRWNFAEIRVYGFSIDPGYYVLLFFYYIAIVVIKDGKKAQKYNASKNFSTS